MCGTLKAGPSTLAFHATRLPVPALVLIVLTGVLSAAGVLSGCGTPEKPPLWYPGPIPLADVTGFTVALADQVDIEAPGALPDEEVLFQLLDAYERSPVGEFVPNPGELVAVVLWRREGEVTEILAGPGYPENQVLVQTVDTSRGIQRRSQLFSAVLVEFIKGFARERLTAEEKRQLDPGGTWLGSAPSAESLADAWAASVAAVERLGPVRVTVLQTAEGRVLEGGTAADRAVTEAQITEVEELLDPPGGRARLTVRGPGGSVDTTVVNGRERITLTGGAGIATTGLVSYSRYVALEPSVGLPLPLWAGNLVPPRHGYADIFGAPLGDGGEGALTGLLVERLEDGGQRLTWERSTGRWKLTVTAVLDADLLPVRVETKGEGELQEGVQAEYALSLAYHFETRPAFSATDFSLDAPEHYWRRGVTYELSTTGPWSEHADWGQYWLGVRVGDWDLVAAEHESYGDDPARGAGAEPGDEFISLFYDRPGGGGDNENIQVTVLPARGRVVEDSRAFAQQRVASGDWVRREMTLAGAAATVYSGALEGGSADRADSIYIYLPDAFVQVSLGAPVDPKAVLDSFQRVE